MRLEYWNNTYLLVKIPTVINKFYFTPASVRILIIYKINVKEYKFRNIL